ncbi:hypothetical protein [Alicyclobacillus sp. SO9]|nr:hypothetical protein [Alicyclobacillus sp. SO9]
MARRVEIEGDSISVHLTGLTSLASFKRHFVIPFASIVRWP